MNNQSQQTNRHEQSARSDSLEQRMQEQQAVQVNREEAEFDGEREVDKKLDGPNRPST